MSIFVTLCSPTGDNNGVVTINYSWPLVHMTNPSLKIILVLSYKGNHPLLLFLPKLSLATPSNILWIFPSLFIGDFGLRAYLDFNFIVLNLKHSLNQWKTTKGERLFSWKIVAFPIIQIDQSPYTGGINLLQIPYIPMF